MAIGGFSTHDASIGYFQRPAIEAIAILFMEISGINSSLHFFAWNRRSFASYWYDPELRLYLAILVIVALFVVAILEQHLNSSDSPVREGVFHAVSMATTTGYTTTDLSLWSAAAPVLLILAACAGGIKVIRMLLIYKQAMREIKRIIHPNGVFAIKLGRHRVSDGVIHGVWGFFSAYVILFLTIMTALIMIAPISFATAFSAVAACLNNLGPGLGDVALNYTSLPDGAKWLLMLAMLFGRLETFTLLVLMTPAFWRR